MLAFGKYSKGGFVVMLADFLPLLAEAGVALLKVMVFSIPEALAIGALAYSLTGEKFVWWKFLIPSLLTGLVMGALAFFSEDKVLPFLIHVLVYMAILSGSFSFCRLAVFWRVLTAVAFATSIYLLLEFLNMGVRYLCHVDLYKSQATFSAKFFSFLPQFIAAGLLAFVFNKGKINLFVTKGKEV